VTTQAQPDTRLRGRRLLPARAAWAAIMILTVVIFIAAVPARLEELRSDPFNFAEGLAQLGLSVEFFASMALCSTPWWH